MEFIIYLVPSAKHALIATLAFILLTAHARSSASPTPTPFIKKSCNTTTYASLCVKTLTPYGASVGKNPLKLCNAALAVAIKAAKSCSATVSKQSKQSGIPRPEALAMKDCIGDMKDAVYELQRTLATMKHLGDADREFQWANAKTYASAAITDAETCVDGFLGTKVTVTARKQIRSCVNGVENLISNALSLINHLY